MFYLCLDIQAAICDKLSIPNLQRMSLTCHAFNHLINHSGDGSNQIKRNSLSKTDLKILNLNFVLSHDSFFSIQQLTELDFSRLTLKKLWGIEETKINVSLLRKLKFIASLYFYKDIIDEWGQTCHSPQWLQTDESKAIHYQQLPYRYLINLISIPCIKNLSLEEGIASKTNPFTPLQTLEDLNFKFNTIENIQPAFSVEILSAEQENRRRKNLLGEWHVAYGYRILKAHNRQDLVSLLETFWEKHQIYHFCPQKNTEDMPSEVFEALCDVLSKKQKQSLGIWQDLILADEQIQFLLKILPGRTIKNLNILLADDVKPQTMQALSDILCAESFIKDNAESRLYFSLETLTQDEKEESARIFNEMLAKFSALNLPWGNLN